MKRIFTTLSLLTLLIFPLGAQANNRVEIILDVSGSMGALAGGEKKMDAAKKAVESAIGNIPSTAQVGLRLYGHRVPNNKKAESCKDSQLVIPFGSVNQAQFKQALGGAMPLGQTPIAFSLEQAAKDFGNLKDEEAVIILVSDGAETCGGDPVQVAKDLIAQGFKLKINTIGFDVDAQTRAQLEGISSATGGTYMDAKDTAQLSTSLQELTQKSVVLQKEKSIYGEAIRGGDSYETAVPIEAGKLYHLDHHQKKNDFDYFYVDITGGQKLTGMIQTGEKGVQIKDGQAKEVAGSQYAGIQIHNDQKQKVVGDVIIGSPNQKRQMAVPTGQGQGGRFFILVGNRYNHQNQNHPFQIDVKDQFDAGSKQDAGETEASSLEIQPGKHQGFLGPNDRTDMFKFSAQAGQALTVKARDREGKIKFRMILSDSDGVKLQTVDSPNAGAAAILDNFILEKGGEYFLSLASYHSGVPNEDYDFEIALSGSGGSAAQPEPEAAKEPEKVSANKPITKIQTQPSQGSSGSAASSSVQTTADVCLLVKGLPFLQKAKLYGMWVGIPLLVGWLIGMIWGYIKGRKAGKRKAQASQNPPSQS